jgi:hypothetical protein
MARSMRRPMPLPPFLQLARIAVSLAACVASTSPLGAQPPSPAPVPPGMFALEITRGTIVGTDQKGKRVSATLRNVVDGLLALAPYHGISVNYVGLENLVIDSVSLRLTSAPSSLDVALAALAEASGRAFQVQRFSPTDILLVPARPVGAGARSVEAFNLTPLLVRKDLQEVDLRVERLATVYKDLLLQFTHDHPRVRAAKEQLDDATARRKTAGAKPGMDSQSLVARIQETVEATVAMMRSSDTSPNFMYHPDTRLLVVVGGPDTLDAMRKIVAALEKNAH